MKPFKPIHVSFTDQIKIAKISILNMTLIKLLDMTLINTLIKSKYRHLIAK